MRAVNLIPADQRGGAGAGAGRSGGAVYVVLGLLGVLAVFALLYGLSAHQISSRKAQVSSLTAKAQQAQARATALDPYTSFATMREQRVQAVSALVDSRFDWAHAFHELGRVLPSNVSVTSLDGTVGSTSTASGATTSSSASAGATAGSSATSATPPGSVPTFMIAGCATGQAEVALMLDRLRLIDGVSEVALQSSTKSGSTGSGGGGGSGSGCGGGDPAFTVQVTFDPLPSVSAAASGSTTTTVSTSTNGVTSTPSAGATR